MLSATVQHLLHEIPFLCCYLEDLLLHKVQIKVSWTFISYKISELTKCCLHSGLKTKGIGVHQALENEQAGHAGNPEPSPSLYRDCQSECRLTTQAAAQTSWVRFLPSLLTSDSYSIELKNGFSREEGSFLAMLTKYILVKKAWDGLKPTEHCVDSLSFFKWPY